MGTLVWWYALYWAEIHQQRIFHNYYHLINQLLQRKRVLWRYPSFLLSRQKYAGKKGKDAAEMVTAVQSSTRCGRLIPAPKVDSVIYEQPININNKAELGISNNPQPHHDFFCLEDQTGVLTLVTLGQFSNSRFTVIRESFSIFHFTNLLRTV